MMAGFQELVDRMTPERALVEIAATLKKLLPKVSEEGRLNFVMQVIGGANNDKVASMVHL